MNTTIFTIIVIVALTITLTIFITLHIFQRRKIAQLFEQITHSQQEVQLASQSLQAEISAHKATQNSLQEEKIARIKVETELEAERRSIDDKVRSQQDMEKSLREEFRNLAGDVLGEQSRRFKQENQESIDVILKPFKDNIREFRERVESIYSRQTEQSGELKSELKRLMELNAQITTETTNLTNALKGNSKVQGDWGEVILETILDNSNLIRGLHYQTQHNIKDEQGNNLRPDVVLNLPNNKQVIIDSKVSLTAYVNSSKAETEVERKAALAAHIASMRQHIKELSSKRYQQLVQSPDFVIMFVPNEPAFLQALQEDHTIWNDAYEKKVIISSPTNLFALLKIVDDLWRRDDQSKNQENIIKYGVALYEQLVAFTTALEGVGAGIDQARAKYDEAYKRLFTGNNNIVRTGERLRKLGLPTTRRQSQRLLDECDMAENEKAIEQQNNDDDE